MQQMTHHNKCLDFIISFLLEITFVTFAFDSLLCGMFVALNGRPTADAGAG